MDWKQSQLPIGFPIRQRFWAISVKIVPLTNSLERMYSGLGDPSSKNALFGFFTLRSGELHSIESLSSSDEESDDDFCCGFFSLWWTRFRLRIWWLFSQTAAIRLRISNFWKCKENQQPSFSAIHFNSTPRNQKKTHPHKTIRKKVSKRNKMKNDVKFSNDFSCWLEVFEVFSNNTYDKFWNSIRFLM